MISAFSKLLRITCVFVFLVFSGACKSTKTIAGGAADAALSSKKIIQNHYQNQLEFATLSGKVRIAYTNGEDAQSVAVSMRIKKDEVIWISAPLGVVKALITPERVSFYNRLENEYFDGDFSYLSSLLGTTVDFTMMQNLLLGNAILDLRDQKFSSAIASGNYALKPRKNNPLYKILFQLEPKHFKVVDQQISQPEKDRLLTMAYSYQEVSGNVLPKDIGVVATDDSSTNTIDLEYKSMDFDKKLNFPYKIPKGFKEIVLE